jgi:hypothetical protein
MLRRHYVENNEVLVRGAAGIASRYDVDHVLEVMVGEGRTHAR